MVGIGWLRSHARVAVPVLVVATAVVTLALTVAHPDRVFFDETYYVNDARDFLEFGVEQGFVVHPPLGKLLIAMSINVFGDTPFGWRILGAVLGVVSVWLVHDMCRRLGMRIGAAGFAALALALDGVWIAQSHTAMLDIHLGFFIVLGTWALVRDRNHVRRGDTAALAAATTATQTPSAFPTPAIAVHVDRNDDTNDPDNGNDQSAGSGDEDNDDAGEPWEVGVLPEPTQHGASDAPPDTTTRHLARLPRPGRGWLALAGVAFGAAVAVKWSGALALVAAGLVVLGWELGRRRRVLGSFTRQPWSWIGLGLGSLVLLPIAVYAVTWIPWFVAFDHTYMASGPCANPDNGLECDGIDRVGALVDYHDRMFDFHLNLDAEHAYRASATGWPIQYRPVVYYYETCSDNRFDRVAETDSDGVVTVPEPCTVPQGSAAEIMSVGNPAVWWLMIAGLPLFGAALRRRSRGSWVVAVFVALQFIPWLGPARPVFNFYTVPLVPFVAMMLAISVDELTSWRLAWQAWLVGIGTAVALASTLVLVALFTTLEVGWTLAWYLLGIVALVGGFIMGTDVTASRPPVLAASTGVAPDLGDTTRVWPLVTVGVIVVGVAIYFLPIWLGITAPSWFVKSHWWLPSWI